MSIESDDDSNTAGFVKRHVYTFSLEQMETGRVELLLPNTSESKKWASDSYMKASTAEAAALAARSELKESILKTAGADEEADEYGDKVPKKAASFTTKSTSDRLARDVETQREALQDQDDGDALYLAEPENFRPVYDVAEPLKLLDLTRGMRSEKETGLAIFNILKAKGRYRRLASVQADEVDPIFSDLLERFALFEDVIEFIRAQVKLDLIRKEPLHITPILLAGPPGTGKTTFAKSLAKSLNNAAYHELSFDSDETSSALMGSSAHWGNSHPGLIFRALCTQDDSSANPLILLDEIDKCRGSHSGYQHPLTSLHSLLEPTSSHSVTDISVGMKLDASQISFIATCNDLGQVLPSIRSRFTTFFVLPATTGEVALKVSREIVRSVHHELALEGFSHPGADVVSAIASLMFPRVMGQALRMAYAAAISAGRTSLSAKDFAHLDPDYTEPKSGATVYH